MFFRWLKIALTLHLIAFSAIAQNERQVGELRIDVFSYVGNPDTRHAQMVRYRILDGYYPIKELKGFVSGSHFVAHDLTVGSFLDPLGRGFSFPETAICNDLLQVQETLPLNEMENRKVLNHDQRLNAQDITKQLNPDQISFVEVKMFDTQRSDPNGIYDIDRSESDSNHVVNMIHQTFFANQGVGFYSQPKQLWKRVGAIRIVSGQVEGKRLPLPFQLEGNTAIPEIPPEMKANFELGRLSITNDIDLKKLLPAAAQRIRKELLALGLDENEGWVFAHAVTKLHVRHYKALGFDEFWISQDGSEAILRMNFSKLLELYPPESLGFRSFQPFKAVLPYRNAFEAYVTDPSMGRIHLRFFANEWWKSLGIPQAVLDYNAFHTFAYRPDEIVQMRSNYAMAFVGNNYVKARDAYSGVFDLHRYYVQNHVIEMDLPFGVTFRGLLSCVGMAAESIERELLSRGIKKPIEWLKENKIQLAYLTRDVNLMERILSIPAGNEIGVRLEVLQKSITPKAPNGPFQPSSMMKIPATSLVIFDLGEFLTAFNDPVKIQRLVDRTFKFDGPETAIRAEPDLD